MSSEHEQPRILLAGNDRSVRELLSAYSLRAGWKYDLAGDADSAMNAVTQHCYDVIITDFMLPGINSLELLKSIHRRDPAQAVIVVAGAPKMSELVELLREGAFDILQKPVDFDSVEQSVKRALTLYREMSGGGYVYRHAAAETTVFKLSSVELAGMRFPLAIADRLYRGGKIDLSTKLRLELAFQEALTNSLEHGNLELESAWKEIIDDQGLDHFSLTKRQRLNNPKYAKRRVTIRIDYKPMRLKIRIKDSGARRWLPASSGKPTAERDLKCFGRGLSLIRSTMDEVSFNGNGSEICMIKHLDHEK